MRGVKEFDGVRELLESVPAEITGNTRLTPAEILDAFEREQDVHTLALDLLSRAVHVREG